MTNYALASFFHNYFVEQRKQVSEKLNFSVYCNQFFSLNSFCGISREKNSSNLFSKMHIYAKCNKTLNTLLLLIKSHF